MQDTVACFDHRAPALCEPSTVETVATRPDSVAQNAFTANKTHVSDTARCSARQRKACPSEHLPVRFAGLPLGLLETCDQHLGEILSRVPTMVTHVGQKQFVHNWTAQASNANQVLLPTRERFDSPLLQKPASQSRRYCASTTPVRQTPPVRTHFLQKAKSDPRSRWSNQHHCHHPNLGPLAQRSPQPLWIHLTSSAVALVCCHCEAARQENMSWWVPCTLPGAHPWEARKSSIVLRSPWEERGRAPKRFTEPMNRSNSKQHTLPKPRSKHQGS